MKKFWIWLVPLISVAIISTGIVIGLNVGKNTKNEVVFATDIYWNIPLLEIESGDTVAISKNEITVEPENCTQKIVFSTNDSNIISVDPQTGEIIANELGECEIIATINSSETTKINARINVVVTTSEINPQLNKNVYTVNRTFQLGQNFTTLTYKTESEYDKCTCNIISGNDCISVIESYKRLDVTFLKVGTATIVVDSPTETTYFYIEIE